MWNEGGHQLDTPGIKVLTEEPGCGLRKYGQHRPDIRTENNNCPELCHLPVLFPASVEFSQRDLVYVRGCGGSHQGETVHLHYKGSFLVGVKAGSWACCLAESF